MTATLFEPVANAADVEPGQGLRCVVRGHAIALFNVDGRFHAIDDRCSHGDASLADGWLDGCEIECPLHQGRFDVTNGRATAAPCVVDVASHPIRIEGGRILVAVPD
jgi:naphthalene 1,2-dioxygenase system ferredoxin subunit